MKPARLFSRCRQDLLVLQAILQAADLLGYVQSHVEEASESMATCSLLVGDVVQNVACCVEGLLQTIRGAERNHSQPANEAAAVNAPAHPTTRCAGNDLNGRNGWHVHGHTQHPWLAHGPYLGVRLCGPACHPSPTKVLSLGLAGCAFALYAYSPFAGTKGTAEQLVVLPPGVSC